MSFILSHFLLFCVPIFVCLYHLLSSVRNKSKQKNVSQHNCYRDHKQWNIFLFFSLFLEANFSFVFFSKSSTESIAVPFLSIPCLTIFGQKEFRRNVLARFLLFINRAFLCKTNIHKVYFSMSRKYTAYIRTE